MFEVIPSPGTEEKDWEAMEKRIKIVEPFASVIHIDVCDGKFAPNTTFMDPTPFKKYTDNIFFEVHLMVEEPISYLKKFADAGFKRFIGQIEKMSDQAEFVAEGQILGEVGLAIDGPTPTGHLKASLSDLDCLLVMTITAGFSGQKFTESHLQKVTKLRQKAEKQLLWEFPIEVDGGINNITLPIAKEKGATRFVSTSFIFGHNNPQMQYKKLLDLL